MAATPAPISARLPKPPDVKLSTQQWRVLTDAIFPNATSAESIQLALSYCAARGLDPFKRPVHIVSMWNSRLRRKVETVWPGIGELQITAARSKAWAGLDEPKWGPLVRKEFTGVFERDNGESTTRKLTVEFPESCSVTVYRIVNGQRCAFAEPVFWLESYARAAFRSELPNDMWEKRPRSQLAKCAKAASLRAAFPEDVGHEYAAEEMEGRETDQGGIVIDHQREPQAPPSDYGATLPPPPKSEVTADYHIEAPTGGGWDFREPEQFIEKWEEGVRFFMEKNDAQSVSEMHRRNLPYLDAIRAFDPTTARRIDDMLAHELGGNYDPEKPDWLHDDDR